MPSAFAAATMYFFTGAMLMIPETARPPSNGGSTSSFSKKSSETIKRLSLIEFEYKPCTTQKMRLSISVAISSPNSGVLTAHLHPLVPTPMGSTSSKSLLVYDTLSSHKMPPTHFSPFHITFFGSRPWNANGARNTLGALNVLNLCQLFP